MITCTKASQRPGALIIDASGGFAVDVGNMFEYIEERCTDQNDKLKQTYCTNAAAIQTNKTWSGISSTLPKSDFKVIGRIYTYSKANPMVKYYQDSDPPLDVTVK